MRKIVPKTSFLGGEAGYLLEGRSDLPQFQLGCLKSENFIALRGGAVTRRPGTRYVKGTQANKPARIIDFVVSYDDDDDIYAVEIALASSTSLTFRVIRMSDNTVYTPSGSPLTVASTINLDEIQYGQIGGALIIVHKSFTPQVLQRTAATPTFSLSNYVALTGVSARPEYYSIPYRDSNITSITLTASAATVGTGRTITASSAFFDAGHVGTYFRHTESATTGWFLVTAFTSSTQVTATILVALGGTAGTTDWQEGAWSTYRGFPRTVTFYNQRAVFGGNTSQPDTFWASQTADYFQMHDVPGSPGVADPQRFTLASAKLNQIRWMVGGKKLTIGTSSSEWVGQFVEDGTTLRVQFDEETSHGSSIVQARRQAYAVPFVQRSKRTIRELVFDFDSDSYVATDLSLFASHIGTPYGRFENSSSVGVIQLAFQESPFNILWAIDSVGRLYGLTRDKQQQVAAWHSHIVGGKMTETILTGLSGPDYPAFVTSICVIPREDGTDRLWMVVRRDINGTDTYFVEYMDDFKGNPFLTAGTATDIKAFLDCATLQTGASSVSWGGYTRFASTTAYVIAENTNGAIVQAGEIDVDGSGAIVLDQAATKVCVGLHRGAILSLLPMEGGEAPQLPLRSIKRCDKTAIRMHQTFGLKIGQARILRKTGWEENSDDFEQIPFDATDMPTLPTFSGIKEVSVPNDANAESNFALAMEDPWPCTILAVSTRVVGNEV